MKKIQKFFLFIYYLIWAICLLLAYAYLTDEYYTMGRWFGPIVGMLTALISALTLLILIVLFIVRKNKRDFHLKLIKLVLLPFIGLIPFFIIKSIPNELDHSLLKVKVFYIAYACECANWKLIEINGKQNSTSEDIFIEAMNPQKELPNKYFQNGTRIELIGRFYKRKGFPIDYIHSEQQPNKARIFQYESFKIMKN
ncbi:MAG: hypothetical protein ACOVP1_06710 [Bacteroidia bacterium]